jgi:hypothetical protein
MDNESDLNRTKSLIEKLVLKIYKKDLIGERG